MDLAVDAAVRSLALGGEPRPHHSPVARIALPGEVPVALEPVDDAPPLTPEEDEGLRSALASLRTGQGRTVDQVRQTIAALLRR